MVSCETMGLIVYMVRDRGAAYCTLRREGAVGAGDFGEKGAELAVVFDAGAGFDSAGHVDGAGSDGEDGCADVFRSEAAGEDDAMGFCGARGDGPVESFARASEFGAHCGIKQKAGGAAKFLEIGHGESGSHAKRLDDSKIVFEIGQLFWRFVAMELYGVQLKRVRQVHNDFRFPIHKNADGFGGQVKRLADFPGIGRSDGTRRFLVEIKAQGIRAESFGEASVLSTSDTADFDFDHSS